MTACGMWLSPTTHVCPGMQLSCQGWQQALLFYPMNHLTSPGSDFSQHFYQVHSMQGYRASLVSFSAVSPSGQQGLDATVTEWCSWGEP